MIHKLDRIDIVIDKVIRDLGLGHNEIPYADFIEWIAEAITHIGSYYQYVEKETVIPIDNYEGRLPCDLYKIKRLKRGSEMKEPAEGGFWGGTAQGTLQSLGFQFEDLTPDQRYSVTNKPEYHRVDNSNIYDSILNTLQYNSNLIGNPGVSNFTGLDWNLNFDKITTAFKHGFIEVQYLSLPIDENGFPLIPDSQSFRDALFWKVAMQLCLRDPSIFKNPQLQNFDYVRSRWNFYCTQARADANMPDIHGMERLKNMFLSLVPRYNEDLNDYKNLGKPQFIDFANGRP